MADVKKAVVPYHDPHEDNDTVVLSEFISSDFGDVFGMAELLNQADDANCVDITLNPSNDTYVQEILDDFINDPTASHSTDANSFWNGEPQTGHPIAFCNYTEPLVASNAPLSCDFFDLLGDTIQTDGIEVSKLEIHGISRNIDHAALQSHSRPDSAPICEFIDFLHGDPESVNQILEQFNEDRRIAGFALVEDRPFVPYATTGTDAYEYLQNDQDPAHQSPVNVGEFEVESSEQQRHFLNAAALSNKTALAIQRERSSRMTLDDFVDYFHLPIEKAAKQLGVCATVVKKICRKHGLARWPHRKIKSLTRRLETLKENMKNVIDGRDRVRIEREIDRTVQQIDQVRRSAAAGQL